MEAFIPLLLTVDVRIAPCVFLDFPKLTACILDLQAKINCLNCLLSGYVLTASEMELEKVPRPPALARASPHPPKVPTRVEQKVVCQLIYISKKQA